MRQLSRIGWIALLALAWGIGATILTLGNRETPPPPANRPVQVLAADSVSSRRGEAFAVRSKPTDARSTQ
jgi:hypothetical protein